MVSDKRGEHILVLGIVSLTWSIALSRVRRRTQEMDRQKQMDTLRNRLVSVLENTSDVISFVDDNRRRVVYINPAGYRLIGLSTSVDLSTLDVLQFYPDRVKKLLKEEAKTIMLREDPGVAK